MRRYCTILIIMLSVLLIVSCAIWKGKATVGYEAAALTLKEIHDQGKSLCEQGKIGASDCENLKSTYNKAREVYIASGDALIAAINAEDAVTREKSLDAYQKSIAEFSQLSIKLIRLASNLGIKVK